MRILFVFVFLLGLFSCGEDKKVESKKKISAESGEQPYCKDLDGVEESEDWERVKYKYKDYTGIIKKCLTNGQVKAFFYVKNGKEHGLQKQWHGEDGQLEFERNYKDGKPDGLTREWYDNGQLRREKNYKDGKIVGLSRIWYGEDGQLADEVNYKDGKKDGFHRMWYENGQLIWERNYKDGRKDGFDRIWYKNGQLKKESNYKNGRLISTKRYDENGNQTYP